MSDPQPQPRVSDWAEAKALDLLAMLGACHADVERIGVAAYCLRVAFLEGKAEARQEFVRDVRENLRSATGSAP